MPDTLKFEDASALNEAVAGFDAFVFSPAGDKASGNVSIFKHWGLLFEEKLQLLGAKIRRVPG